MKSKDSRSEKKQKYFYSQMNNLVHRKFLKEQIQNNKYTRSKNTQQSIVFLDANNE